MIYTIMLLFCVNLQANTIPKFDAWSKKVCKSTDQPKWKKHLASKNPQVVRANFTKYSDNDAIDPRTGGGSKGCTWTNPNGKRLDGVRLRWGHLAADTRHWPTGSCFYSPQLNRLMIVVDSGPGVRGRNRFDVYCGNWKEWKMVSKKCNSTGNLYYLGRITKRQAMGNG